MMDKCLACSRDLPVTMVQQAGMHIDCANQSIDVYQISIEGVGMGPTSMDLDSAIEEVRLHYSEGNGSEPITIFKKQMTRLEYYSLPEFIGY